MWDADPQLGRDFLDGEDQPSAAKTVILTYASWQKRYGGSKDVIGQTILLSDLLQQQASLATAEDQYRQALLAFWAARALPSGVRGPVLCWALRRFAAICSLVAIKSPLWW